MTALLGGLSPRAFLGEHWQKQPLLVRQAVPGFAGIVDRDHLLALATRDDAISRLVIEHPRRRGRARWERHDGPFLGLEAGQLPASHWTLLVHGLEGLVPGGWELLREFSFIPAARVDDLMVSYASSSGSVGPHDDLYDVFLLQGPGRRRWQIMRGGDRSLDPDAAIKVLRNFVPDEEWVLEPGDMLYLPPGVAHWGVAEGPCYTYSIGFLAPSRADLVKSFLDYLAHAQPPTSDLYEDPDLVPTDDPFELGKGMLDQVAAMFSTIRWDAGTVTDFTGRFLTMPRAHVSFSPPKRLPSLAGARGGGRLTLALRSRGLVCGRTLFMNGQAFAVSAVTAELCKRLLAERSLLLPPRLEDGLFQTFVARGWAVLTRGDSSRAPAPRRAR